MQNSIIKSFYALGTVNSIKVYGENAAEAAMAAMKRVIEINNRMSVYLKGSDLYKLNKLAGKEYAELSQDSINVIKRGIYFNNITNEAFDIKAQPLTNLWRKSIASESIPDRSDRINAMNLMKGELLFDEDNKKAKLCNLGQSVGLGGIAKGYAADEALKVLKKHNIKDALIILGGNIWAIGNKNNSEWKVGIQNPVNTRGTFMGTVNLHNETIVTSGSNEQFFIKDGIRYHHILDPRTGRPAQTDLFSVTVIGNNSMDMDALATSAFILGMTEGTQLVNNFNAQAIFVDTSLDIHITKGLIGRFELTNNNSVLVNGGKK